MKKFIIAFIFGICAFGVYAETSEITTSQYYVDTKLSEKQDAAPANNANSVMTYDSTSADGVGAKAIYNETSTYETQKTSLVTAGTANDAIQNAINMEFTCANPPKCTLWDMTAQTHLPAGYTELEYIESTGTQYIDTGYVATNGFKVDFTIIPTDLKVSRSVMYIIGSHQSGPPYKRNFVAMASNSRNFTIGAGGYVQDPQTVTPVINNSYHIVANTFEGVNKITINSIDYPITVTSETGRSRNSVYLFFENGYNTLSIPFIGKIFTTKMWDDNNNLVRNLIPARRNTDGKIGMYDTVTNTFKTNLGSGTFTAGPVASYVPQNVQ